METHTAGTAVQADGRGRLRVGDPHQFWLVTQLDDGSILAAPGKVVTDHEAALDHAIEIAAEVDRSLADSSQAQPARSRRSRESA